MKYCYNCAWYCHADGKCYGVEGVSNGYPVIWSGCACSKWAADGLSDEERASLYPNDALMTADSDSRFPISDFAEAS